MAGRVPAALLERELVVRRRRGIDLAPIDATSPEGYLLLRSFLWPGLDDRVARLDAAVETLRRMPDAAGADRGRLREALARSPRRPARRRADGRLRDVLRDLPPRGGRARAGRGARDRAEPTEAARLGLGEALGHGAGARRPSSSSCASGPAPPASRASIPTATARLAPVITSRDNETLKLVRKLLGQRKHRDESGLFAAEGEDLVEAASERRHRARAPARRRARRWRRICSRGVSTLPHPARVIGVYRRADLPTGARECASPSGGCPIPGTSGPCCVRRTRSAPVSRSRRAAPTRSRRRPCGPRPARSSARRS